MTATDVLIVGGGMAAGRLCAQLHAGGFTGTTTVLTEEETFGYNRVLLPEHLSGAVPRSALLNDPINTTTLQVLTGVRAVRLDPAQSSVTTDDGQVIAYQSLVLATGSGVRWPDFPGAKSDRVLQLRSLEDSSRLESCLLGEPQIAVLGGGLLGLEAAGALAARGARVSVVHRGPRLMTHQIDDACAHHLMGSLQQLGVNVHLSATPERYNESRRELALSSGEVIPAEWVVACTGVTPNTQLAEQAGIHCEYGIVTNRWLETNQPHTYAVGECARVDGQHFGWVEAVYRQVDALARTLVGERTPFEPLPLATRLKLPDVSLFTAGDVPPQPQQSDWVLEDRQSNVYRRLAFDGARLIGAVLFGDAAGSSRIAQAVGQLLEEAQSEALMFAAET